MYTIAKNAQIVLVLLKKHNIRHIIINPGATNIPIVQGIQNDEFFQCYSIVDERSAMYFAIGLHLDTGEPVAITCTSAQATRNYLPGLTEAFYKNVPILAITVSKHPKYNYQGYPQHPIQASVPEDTVKRTFALPYVSDHIDELQCIRMSNEAILELSHRTPGPVQLNLPMLDDELVAFTESELPDVRMINRYMQWDEWNDLKLIEKKIMIVVGEHRPFSNKQRVALEAFAESHNAFIYVNHLSNYHGEYTVPANIVLSVMSDDAFKKIYKPDILITIGGQTGDYPLLRKLSAGSECDFEHWHVKGNGEVVDTYDKLTKVFECPFDEFLSRLALDKQSSHQFFKLWKAAYDSILIPDNLPLSNAFLAQQLHNAIPNKSYINFAILNSLRNWSLFPLDSSIVCYSNVAAFGIDGCMSTFLGQSIVTSNLCFLVIGDLSFFYDMNSLGIRHLKNNIRILLVNNGCGVEFRMNLKLYQHIENDIFPYIAAKGHYRDAKGWAESCGFRYLSAATKEEFCIHKDVFISESEQPMVFEVFINPDDEVLAYKNIMSENHIESKAKSIARSVLGKKGVGFLKSVVKK
ncbi:thiamine pyrophosphate-binding protein [uncultured Desulfobacter sp.]|uniref:thiamine pyrophosphate-binding protein n=1 Tax=uncultured Desulfobacter sp. TaxID=240139 RepID=UPI0029F47225|nr:thiamine pyrophosphate-binding protein [uncultured Desulfobacter sp.]